MAVKPVGLAASKTWTPDAYTSVTCAFWAILEFKLNPLSKTGHVILVPFTDKARFLANNFDFYKQGQVTLFMNANNWTWDGSSDFTRLVTFIKAQASVDGEGAEINGGVDWANATLETVTIP